MKTTRKIILESDRLMAEYLALDRKAESLESDIHEAGTENIEKQNVIDEIKNRQKRILAKFKDLSVKFWNIL